MNKLRAFWVRLRNTPRRAESNDFGYELEAHLAMDTERGVLEGLSAEEARRQALIRFGGTAQAHEAYGERRGLPWLEALLRDVHYSMRTLARNRMLTGIAILSIGTGSEPVRIQVGGQVESYESISIRDRFFLQWRLRSGRDDHPGNPC
jgi:hypothetical protein